ncbi:MAG TPA: sulfatase-like hydrolase/transferase, partial [Verrucomicrobiae bacterium]|nr:sulfatase-like hydrolase/transferase [Verrucomicrobiae bacterium]
MTVATGAPSISVGWRKRFFAPARLWICRALVLIGLPLSGFAAAARPNILFLLSDDQRFDTIHALGNSTIQTPNLDRLVARGRAFDHAFIMGGGQGAICAPSRAMIMTGHSLFHATTTYTGTTIPPELPLLPEIFQKAGYETAAIGKWHNDRAAFQRAFSTGGPIFFGGMAKHDQVPVYDFDPAGA